MKFVSTFIAVVCFSILGLTGLVYAQDVPVPEVTNDAFIQLLLASLGGMKGATALVLIGVVVKLLVAFMSTPWANQIFKKFSGQMKLLIISGLTIVSGIITQMSLGVTFVAALLQSATLTAILVFINQIYKQFFVKSEPTISASNINK